VVQQEPALRGARIDRATQRWVVATGRRVPVRDHPWLDGPVGSPTGIGTRWITEHADRVGAELVEDRQTGLLPDLGVLEGPGFDPRRLHTEVRRFYEVTAGWELEVWSRWSRWAEPGGRLLNGLFARRVRQLSLPLDPLRSRSAWTAGSSACARRPGATSGRCGSGRCG
jgi:hypothetical protein